VAKRYPYVRHFLVWNEFKGFFDDELRRWDAKGYTDLYNVVYDAVKAVDPANQVGGPYLSFESKPLGSPDSSPQLQGPWGAVDQRSIDAFVYWKLQGKGADFVVVDAHATTEQGAPDEFAAVQNSPRSTRGSNADQCALVVEWYVEPARSGWSSGIRLRCASPRWLSSR
jgi:hypothetical protein